MPAIFSRASLCFQIFIRQYSFPSSLETSNIHVGTDSNETILCSLPSPATHKVAESGSILVRVKVDTSHWKQADWLFIRCYCVSKIMAFSLKLFFSFVESPWCSMGCFLFPGCYLAWSQKALQKITAYFPLSSVLCLYARWHITVEVLRATKKYLVMPISQAIFCLVAKPYTALVL